MNVMDAATPRCGIFSVAARKTCITRFSPMKRKEEEMTGKPAASAAMLISIQSHNPIAPQPPPVVRRHLQFLHP